MTRTLPTVDLVEAGQSPWLDFISREILKTGKLKGMIENQGLMGVTSNPSIFEKAINQAGGGYDEQIKKKAKNSSTLEIYDALTIADIQETCGLFLPVFKKTKGAHGFVSLEVIPSLAYDTETTISEARRLYKEVNRPNVMIKIPATPEGVAAVRAVISEGINVNVTLMFSMKHYRDVANAYIEGLEILKDKGGDLSRVFSVSSVFVSRIDTYLDKKLDDLSSKNPALVQALKGKAAVANSKMIYQEFKGIFESARFKKLQAAGANLQKVLWGSTSVKNPAYSDLLYVENLVGSETVNTLPSNTFDALMDHGIIRRNTIEENLEDAKAQIADLKKLGFDLIEVGEKLQKDGVKAFIDSFDQLMRALELKRWEYQKGDKKAPLSWNFSFGKEGEPKGFAKKIEDLQKNHYLKRFLQKEAGLWKSDAAHQAVINNRLGWLRAHDWALGKLVEIDRLKAEVEKEKIKNIVLLGMGGSSLAPEVMESICPKSAKAPRFFVVDTTDPSSILKVEKQINLKATLVIVASKSGGTIETSSQYLYFFDRVQKACGKKKEEAGKHFVAITDEGSALEKLGYEKKFRRVLINPTDIGGRFSALSYFGLVPAALCGIDVRALLKRAAAFYDSMSNAKTIESNPSVYAGLFIAALASQGQDKLTLWFSKTLAGFGAWLEQLVAESTGKEGQGVVPVDTETLFPISGYGFDRVFLSMSLKSEKAQFAKAVKAAKKAGYPVIEIVWPDRLALGEAFLAWEIATAFMGVYAGTNPFDEPNVKESKDITNALLQQFEKNGKLPEPSSIVKDFRKAPWENFLNKIKQDSYIAVLAYTERTPVLAKAMGALRGELTRRYGVPVLLGFGPRYLHSIGQLYKGGPRKGLFIEFLTRETKDAAVPTKKYSFGQLKRAQALGDMQALESKGLPVLSFETGKDTLKSVRQAHSSLSGYLKQVSSNKR